MNRLSVGMTKDQVFAIMGQPQMTAAPGAGVEVLRYSWPPPLIDDFRQQYFVKFVGGKLDSYGKMGDFDSTKDPTLNLNIKQR